MRPKEVTGELETCYLRTMYELAGGKAKCGVSFALLQQHLGLSDEQANYCCDFWIHRGTATWSTLGHVALTHLGLARAEQVCCADAERNDEKSPHGAGVALVSVVIPVLNESKTIDRLVRLARLSPAVCEVLVIDDGSIDGTADVASRAGARVMMSSMLGKGASMKDGIDKATGNIVLFLDGDLTEIQPSLVDSLIAPIVAQEADLVKAKFTREAGRVTILTARPLLATFFPELGGLDQPLGGIVAIRRSLAANLRLENDYGVDVGLLIDAAAKGAKVAEVDIGRIDHQSQSLEALGQMAKQVTRVILDRAWRYERLSINGVREMEERERRTKAEVLLPTVPPATAQKFALFDMDGVLLDGRFIVSLAERLSAQSELTSFLDNDTLQNGERTRQIAALFTGVRQDAFEEVAQSIPLMEGAVETVVALRAAGYTVGIVTDSFYVAAETVRRRVFADFCVANILHFHKGASTGEVTLSPAMMEASGCPLHSCCKSNVLRHLQKTAGLKPQDTLAVGDGTNDICILRMAGFSVAFRPKSKFVQRAAKYTVRRSLVDILDLLSGETSRNLASLESIRRVRTLAT